MRLPAGRRLPGDRALETQGSCCCPWGVLALGSWGAPGCTVQLERGGRRPNPAAYRTAYPSRPSTCQVHNKDQLIAIPDTAQHIGDTTRAGLASSTVAHPSTPSTPSPPTTSRPENVFSPNRQPLPTLSLTHLPYFLCPLGPFNNKYERTVNYRSRPMFSGSRESWRMKR